MNTANGFICLYRQITQWEWYQNPNTFRLFVHLLLMANFTDGRFEGREVKRGQLVTSLPSLSKQTSLSIRQVRVALEHLIMTGEVTNKSFTKYRVITVVKYDQYQRNDRQNDSQMTDKRQTNDSQMTDKRQQYNNDNKEKNYVGVNTDNILTLTPTDIAESIRNDEEIENAALNVGLTVSASSIQRARDLEHRYGHDKLIEAIKMAVDVPKWSYVEGILRNADKRKESSDDEKRAAMQRMQERAIQAMKRRGEWDDEYDCNIDLAAEYRAKGLTPEQVRKGVG